LIALPTQAEASLNLVGRIGTASGFGRDNTGFLSNTLNAVNLTVVQSSTCSIYQNWFTNGHFCTANPGAQSICAGDGGEKKIKI
jgi:hypothetical protein